MKYGYTKGVSGEFSDVLERTRKALTQEGFGILTEIDVRATLKKKLNVDYAAYVILGACNPPFAYQALQSEKEIGLLLPCNVIVYEKKEGVFVSAILPTVAMSVVGNALLTPIVQEVEKKLKKMVDLL